MAIFVTARHNDTYQDNDNPPAGIIYNMDCLIIGTAGEIPVPQQHVIDVSVLGDDSVIVLNRKITDTVVAYFARPENGGYTVVRGNITNSGFTKGV